MFNVSFEKKKQKKIITLHLRLHENKKDAQTHVHSNCT